MRTLAFALATLIAVSTASLAGEVESPSSEISAAFERLKGLVGEWEADTTMGRSHLSYELIGHGTALVERESFGKGPAMMTVYHMDGDRLLLTHYCMAGNQPRMRAKAFNPATGEMQFEFLDATNLPNSKAPHMHNATIQVSNRRLVQKWQFYENEQLKETHSAEYTRVR